MNNDNENVIIRISTRTIFFYPATTIVIVEVSRKVSMEEIRTIKEVLQDYVKVEKDIDYQIERLEAMQQRMISVQSPAMTGMPSGSHAMQDKNAELVANVLALESEIKEMIEAHSKERKRLEGIINGGLEGSEEKAVIRMRYLDLMPWKYVCFRMFGSNEDFEQRSDSYLRRVMSLHKVALENLDAYIS